MASAEGGEQAVVDRRASSASCSTSCQSNGESFSKKDFFSIIVFYMKAGALKIGLMSKLNSNISYVWKGMQDDFKQLPTSRTEYPALEFIVLTHASCKTSRVYAAKKI